MNMGGDQIRDTSRSKSPTTDPEEARRRAEYLRMMGRAASKFLNSILNMGKKFNRIPPTINNLGRSVNNFPKKVTSQIRNINLPNW